MWQVSGGGSGWISPPLAVLVWGVAIVVTGWGRIFLPQRARWLPKFVGILIAAQAVVLGAGLTIGWNIRGRGGNPSDTYVATAFVYGATWVLGLAYTALAVIRARRRPRVQENYTPTFELARRVAIALALGATVAGGGSWCALIAFFYAHWTGSLFAFMTDAALVSAYEPCCILCSENELDELARRPRARRHDASRALKELRARVDTPEALAQPQMEYVTANFLSCQRLEYAHPEVNVLLALAKRGEPGPAHAWLADPGLSAALKAELAKALASERLK